MNPLWRTFINEQTGTLPLADGPCADNCVLTDLDAYGFVHFQGNDADSFLQGQLTNDVSALRADACQLSAWCNTKGRVEVLFRLYRWNGGILAQCPRAQVDALIARLRMFVLRADVQIIDLRNEWVCFDIAGPTAASLLGVQLASRTDQDSDVVAAHGGLLTRASGASSAFQFSGPVDAAMALWRQVAAAAAFDRGQWWSVRQIRTGVPHISVETQGQYLPQMINLDRLDGVSFLKGCYLGQEIVARTQYLGRLKRRMFHVAFQAHEQPCPGDLFYQCASGQSQSVGSVVMATATDADQYEALAVLRLDAADGGGLRLGSLSGPDVVLLELPYSLEVKSA